MIATALTFLKAHKAIAMAMAAAVLLIALIWMLRGIYSDGKEAGQNEVTGKVQTETLRKLDEARTEKEKANEAVRNKPLDAVIEGLK